MAVPSTAPSTVFYAYLPSIKPKWWKQASVYQIYPSSFLDSTGSGTGDLRGIIKQLDYIKELGVDVVWLSPILLSPQVDMGYDISDYRAIDPRYGTMDDHDQLIAGLHARGIKYVMDLVVNHTSDQHPWFQHAKSSKLDKYRDFYIWKPPRGYNPETGDPIPPNNWESYFGGSAWGWDEETQEFYLHLFAPEQPDLNWENPRVVSAVHEIIWFWLHRGVDGFRMDVINFISKEPGLPDAEVRKPGFLQNAIKWHSCGPRLHEYLQGIGDILEQNDAFSVGEMPGVKDAAEIVKAVGQDRKELGMAFQFEMVTIDNNKTSKFLPPPKKEGSRYPFLASEMRCITDKWQTFMLKHSGWNALYLENHDQGRSISRFASDSPQYRTISAKLLATFITLQSGTVFIYQGQELGMPNVPAEWAEKPEEHYRDVETLNHWNHVKECTKKLPSKERKKKQDEALAQYRRIGRDNARTPMQWNDSKHAGFCPSKLLEGVDGPWMEVHPDYAEWNAQKLMQDKNSIFHWWKDLLKLRRTEAGVFVYGGFEMLDLDKSADGKQETEEDRIIAYVRIGEVEDAKKEKEDKQGEMKMKIRKALVITSFSDTEVDWRVPEQVVDLVKNGDMVMHSYLEGAPKIMIESGEGTERDGQKQAVKMRLRPFEACVVMD